MSRPQYTANERSLLGRRLLIDELVLRSQNVYILNIIPYADHIYGRRVPLAAVADNNLSTRTEGVRHHHVYPTCTLGNDLPVSGKSVSCTAEFIATGNGPLKLFTSLAHKSL